LKQGISIGPGGHVLWAQKTR
jgi:hypothetical protein